MTTETGDCEPESAALSTEAINPSRSAGGSDFEAVARVVEIDGDGLVAVDREWRYVYANAIVEQLIGRPVSDLLGRCVWDVLPGAVGGPAYRIYHRAMADREPATFEEYSPVFDLWLEHRCLPTTDGGLLVFFRDVTERRRSEAALAHSEAHLSAIIGAATDAILCLDAERRIVVFNAAAERMFGWSAEEANGAPLDTLFPERVRAHYLGYLQRAHAAEPASPVPTRTLFVALRKDGRELPVEASLSPVRVGDQWLYVAVARDITERRAAHRERMRLQRERERLQRERERDAVRQRAFVRDVLFSVTEGRLRLCGDESELPPQRDRCVAVSDLTASSLQFVRTAAFDAAERCGLTAERAADLLMAVGEAAMNAVIHAGGGECVVCGDTQAGVVQVWLTDSGRGIDMELLPKAALQRGFTTAGTMGHGFKMILASADRVWLMTGARGTTVVLEQGRSEPELDYLPKMPAPAATLLIKV